MLVEELDELGEIRKRPGQAIDLVDNDDVDRALDNGRQQRLQGRPLQGAAREATIVVALGTEAPALMRLRLDVGLGGLALGIKRVEFLLEPMLGRFAGVDGATPDLR